LITLHFRRFNKRPLEERVRIQKHKIIAQAFAKRRDLSHMGRMSISIHSTHDDPVGFNIDLNSAASQDVSSAWAAAIPKFVTRRGAIVGAAGAFGLRRNSLDSEISLSAVRRISVGSQSRRHSLDSHHSQYSIQSQAIDLERLSRLHLRQSGRKRAILRGSKGRRLALKRRGSITSQTSSKGSQILPAITKRRELLLSRSTIDAETVDEKRQERQQVDLERIERFSLNLPGDGSSDDSDLEVQKVTNPDAKVTQSTQTTCAWDATTQTTPNLRLLPRLSSAANKATTSQSKATQMTPSTSAESSPEAIRKSQKPTSKCHRERGQADGSPNGSSSDLSEPETIMSPSKALLDYLLPVTATTSNASHLADEKNADISKSK
jgi:hypothetical protein